MLYLMAVHEIGHVLGLNHSADTSAIMYCLLNSQNVNPLAVDDIRGMQALYGEESENNEIVNQMHGGRCTLRLKSGMQRHCIHSNNKVANINNKQIFVADPNASTLTICGDANTNAMVTEKGGSVYAFKGRVFQ